MKIDFGRARPSLDRLGILSWSKRPGAPKTCNRTDGSAIRPYLLLLALILASCAAPVPTMSYSCMMSLERIRMHP
jgi:hypothetical protein